MSLFAAAPRKPCLNLHTYCCQSQHGMLGLNISGLVPAIPGLLIFFSVVFRAVHVKTAHKHNR